MYLNRLTGHRALGEWPGIATVSEFILVTVANPPNWKPCEGEYGTASGDLDIERVSSFLGPIEIYHADAERNTGTIRIMTYPIYRMHV